MSAYKYIKRQPRYARIAAPTTALIRVFQPLSLLSFAASSGKKERKRKPKPRPLLPVNVSIRAWLSR
jgi:hypothetical protein